MPEGVERGKIGEQHLRGADVGIGLFAADVLFAGLQRHAQGGVAVRVARAANDAPGQGADVFLAGGEKGGVRAAKTHRDAETLG